MTEQNPNIEEFLKDGEHTASFRLSLNFPLNERIMEMLNNAVKFCLNDTYASLHIAFCYEQKEGLYFFLDPMEGGQHFLTVRPLPKLYDSNIDMRYLFQDDLSQSSEQKSGRDDFLNANPPVVANIENFKFDDEFKRIWRDNKGDVTAQLEYSEYPVRSLDDIKKIATTYLNVFNNGFNGDGRVKLDFNNEDLTLEFRITRKHINETFRNGKPIYPEHSMKIPLEKLPDYVANSLLFVQIGNDNLTTR